MEEPSKPIELTEGDSLNFYDSKQQTSSRGWSLLESFLAKLDKGMVSDFNDDINTLLTFAGLFSAVLTAFLSPTYQLLQQNSADVTNQFLGQISLQIANNSAPAVSSSEDFEAASSAVWINTLWFLSLILSLAAAFFGMLAKQWLREYLQWTSLSGPSEQQVRLRHVRYAAFFKWRTPAIIASIPALLELAVIMFLIGVEILLWTLNTVVFSICSIAVIGLISLAFITTVLPAIAIHCPYKSPVGWACLLAVQNISSLWRRFARSCQRTAQDTDTPFVKLSDWRDRDLELQVDATCGDYKVVLPDFQSDRRHMTNKFGGYEHKRTAFTLACALQWISEASQDARILHAIEECRPTYSLSSWHAFSRLAFDFHLACQFSKIDHDTLVPYSFDVELRNMRRRMGGRAASVDSQDNNGFNGPVLQLARIKKEHVRAQIVLPGGAQQDIKTQIDAQLSPSMRVCLAQSIACDLLSLLELDWHYFDVRIPMYLQGASLLSTWLMYSAAYSTGNLSVATSRLTDLFHRLLRDIDKVHAQWEPLLGPLFQFLHACELLSGRRLMLTADGDTRFTQLALKFPPGDPYTWNIHQCALFVRISSEALAEWAADRNNIAADSHIPALWTRMEACATRTLALEMRDCGVPYDSFHWPARLRRLFDPSYKFYEPNNTLAPYLPHTLFNILEQCREKGLITDAADSDHLMRLYARSLELGALHVQESGNNDPSSVYTWMYEGVSPARDFDPGSNMRSGAPRNAAHTVDLFNSETQGNTSIDARSKSYAKVSAPGQEASADVKPLHPLSPELLPDQGISDAFTAESVHRISESVLSTNEY